MAKRILIFLIFLSIYSTAFTQSFGDDASFKDRLFTGGSFGMSFGTVTFVNVSPILGYMITQRWSAGIGVLVQYVNDKRFLPALERWDYGGSIFTRYAIFQPLFLHAEYEYLNYEFADQRYGYTSVLAGGGISQPIGKKASFNMVALYNFTYDPTENPRPYNSPVVFRVGFTAGF